MLVSENYCDEGSARPAFHAFYSEAGLKKNLDYQRTESPGPLSPGFWLVNGYWVGFPPDTGGCFVMTPF